MGTYLGQNFLTDSKIRQWIADKVSEMFFGLKAERLVEIGGGKGAITKLIKGISDDFVVIEKDKELENGLREIVGEKGEIIIGDILKIDIKNAEDTLVVGNLPYYITSPILRKVVEGGVKGGLFMVQAEVGKKIDMNAKKKSYLYWLVNYGYEVKYVKSVPAKSFNPPPKVKSCMISLEKKTKKPEFSYEVMVSFLNLFCPYSRKTLGKIAKMIENRDKQARFLIPEKFLSKRLEELDFDDLKFLLNSGDK